MQMQYQHHGAHGSWNCSGQPHISSDPGLSDTHRKQAEGLKDLVQCHPSMDGQDVQTLVVAPWVAPLLLLERRRHALVLLEHEAEPLVTRCHLRKVVKERHESRAL